MPEANTWTLAALFGSMTWMVPPQNSEKKNLPWYSAGNCVDRRAVECAAGDRASAGVRIGMERIGEVRIGRGVEIALGRRPAEIAAGDRGVVDFLPGALAHVADESIARWPGRRRR